MVPEPEPKHVVIGIATWVVLIAAFIVDGFAFYTVRRDLFLALGVMFLILIGMGAYLEIYLENR